MPDDPETPENAYRPQIPPAEQETAGEETSGEGTGAAADETSTPTQATTLRWWPAAILLVLMFTLRILPGFFDAPSIGVMMLGFMGPTAIGVLLLLWWLLASRAAWREKLLGLMGFLVIAAIGISLTHYSLHGMGVLVMILPSTLMFFGLALILTANRPEVRLPAALVTATVVLGLWMLVKNEGFTGRFEPQFLWRWQPSAEDAFMADLENRARAESPADEPGVDASQSSDRLAETLASAQWPSFRGPDRAAVVHDVALSENWETEQPKEIWRIKVGPGWSSFSVAGNRIYTQEQRGEQEAVICLDAESGNLIWEHTYPSRFWEAIGGAGPRATPTLSPQGVFTLGADGILLCLDPASGEVVWQRDLKEDAGRAPPEWGFSASPLVVDGLAVVHAGGSGELGILAYNVTNGEIVWTAPSGNHSYSSLQHATINGVPGLLMSTNEGLQFLTVEDGETIWQHDYPTEGYRVVQPLVVGNSILIGSSIGSGTRKISAARNEDDAWDISVDWTEQSIKPDYNDFVIYEGHLYGFDSGIFACVDVESGERKWKRGRYGNGQVLLLGDSGQLLITSEKGDVVLVRATPDRLDERAKFSALDGKTWNHPVLIENRLYARNSAEAACFELPLKETPASVPAADEG